ncbi:glutamate receptor ionotropic, NMDA 3B-like [Penaeus chinensis]|uniref:glutamate receptor ionotropic, NMDA 3B-like n=1 Tax=Penaeus chinensis TaxID=139456 RepID=UPI001FB6D901|nr:glutamate receptor ionotropic, NMDA 3B-like [Penaeus chinensis]
MDRSSFMAGNGYVILPSRLQQYDFTSGYIVSYQSFVMATPSLAPRWDNLLFPLSWEVWVSVIAASVVLAGVLTMLGQAGRATYPSLSQSVLEVYKILLGQDFSQWRARTTASRIVIAAWLVVALIVGVAYRGNLTASLTSPVYPPRPETAAALVKAVERINIPPYGADWKKFYLASNSEVFNAIGKLLYVGPSMEEGLRLTAEKNHAVIANRQFLDYVIAQNFTDATGKARLYVAQSNLETVFLGYPIPHGAPYKPLLDRIILAFTESGLFLKWHGDQMDEVRAAIFSKQRQQEGRANEAASDGQATSLTIAHMQGPFLFLTFGLVTAFLVFLVELVFRFLLNADR